MPGNSKTMHFGILLNIVIERVSSYSATDKMSMYETPLTSMFEFGVGVLGLRRAFLYWSFGFWHFLIGVLCRDPGKVK